ncbi:hypothetical protein [Paraglaciecola sp. 25GB23A]|uniref:hypothetical protein n=1 Tax=Paraglaciecola sp. 25GB23A TaxID=3156068 RepID=UPI0032AF7DB2
MCSSPKSNSASRANRVTVKAFCEDLNQEQRKRFVQVANRADDRRQTRLATQARWQQKNDYRNTAPHHRSFWTRLSDALFGSSTPCS